MNAKKVIFYPINHMNYLIIKNIIETTLAHFICKDCGEKASEQDVQILGTAGNSLNMEIICPKCRATGVIKAEMNVVSNIQDPAVRENMKKMVEELKKSQSIKDEDILRVREDLKQAVSVQDLFK